MRHPRNIAISVAQPKAFIDAIRARLPASGNDRQRVS
jgi:hypothetical protein